MLVEVRMADQTRPKILQPKSLTVALASNLEAQSALNRYLRTLAP